MFGYPHGVISVQMIFHHPLGYSPGRMDTVGQHTDQRSVFQQCPVEFVPWSSGNGHGVHVLIRNLFMVCEHLQ